MIASKKVSVLGSTGSIGRKTLEIISRSEPGTFSVQVLVANKNFQILAEQAINMRAKRVAIFDKQAYKPLSNLLRGSGVEIFAGLDGCLQAVETKVDLVISAISGLAGLRPTLAALKESSTLAIANKETLVCARECIKSIPNLNLIPLDSEHHAIYQIYNKETSSITLTASGGPFFLHKPTVVTREAALNHPIWKMGPKNSIDSATLVNKVLEVFEAEVLFNIHKRDINLLVHPQSILHGMVSYKDGNNIAVLYNPDMGIPIINALYWPKRMHYPNPLNLANIGSLTFHKADPKQYPALELIHSDKSLVINAANEVAVELFLDGKISFDKIVPLITETIEHSSDYNASNLSAIMALDAESRKLAHELAEKFSLTHHLV